MRVDQNGGETLESCVGVVRGYASLGARKLWTKLSAEAGPTTVVRGSHGRAYVENSERVFADICST